MKIDTNTIIILSFFLNPLFTEYTSAQELIVDGDSKITGILDLAKMTNNNNLSIGLGAGFNGDSLEIQNSYVGYYAGNQSTGACHNTGLGSGALLFNILATLNTASGYQSLNRCETHSNTAVGSLSLQHLYGNITNSSFGYNSGVNLEQGFANTFLGSQAGRDMQFGNLNLLIGQACGLERTEGSENVIIGHSAGRVNSGDKNVIIGENAARNNQGSNNIIIGYQAAINQLPDSNMLWIENSSSTTPLIFGDFESDRIGINCKNPTATLSVSGDIMATAITQLTTACSSDKRFKYKVRNLESVLRKFQVLRPIKYRWKRNTIPKIQDPETMQSGFIAQEVEEVFPELVYADQVGFRSLDYSRLTVVLTQVLSELDQNYSDLKNLHDNLLVRLDLVK